MSKKQDKLFTDLQRLLDSQNFKSEDEAKKFMESIVGKEIPSFPSETLTMKEKAQDLVFEAYELKPAKARQNIEQALLLDINCIEAYEFLGVMENSVEISMVFYEKGIAIGREIFGGPYLKKNKGMFWGLHETRPFMRCLHLYADCLYTLGKVKESVAVLEEIIELNPNDNQGVRDELSLYLIELDDREKFEKYAKMFEWDDMAFSLFNRALFAFKTEGETEHANQQLQKALKQNKFVAARLLSKKEVSILPEYYGFGDENEAEYYAGFAQFLWRQTEGALDWLKKHSGKP